MPCRYLWQSRQSPVAEPLQEACRKMCRRLKDAAKEMQSRHRR